MQQPFNSSVKPTRHKRWHARPFLICHGQTWPNQRGGSRGGAASSEAGFVSMGLTESSLPNPYHTITHHSVLLIHLLGWSLCCCWFTMLPLCNWVPGNQATGPRSPSSNPSNSALCVVNSTSLSPLTIKSWKRGLTGWELKCDMAMLMLSCLYESHNHCTSHSLALWNYYWNSNLHCSFLEIWYNFFGGELVQLIRVTSWTGLMYKSPS